MAKKRKDASVWCSTCDPAPLVEDGYICMHCKIVITGDFHAGIGRLLVNLVGDQIRARLHDLLDYLHPSAADPFATAPREEVKENE